MFSHFLNYWPAHKDIISQFLHLRDFCSNNYTFKKNTYCRGTSCSAECQANISWATFQFGGLWTPVRFGIVPGLNLSCSGTKVQKSAMGEGKGLAAVSSVQFFTIRIFIFCSSNHIYHAHFFHQYWLLFGSGFVLCYLSLNWHFSPTHILIYFSRIIFVACGYTFVFLLRFGCNSQVASPLTSGQHQLGSCLLKFQTDRRKSLHAISNSNKDVS